jgi:hypothetical protein
MSMDSPLTQSQYAESIGVKWGTAKMLMKRADMSAAKHDPLTPETQKAISGGFKKGANKTGNTATKQPATKKPVVIAPITVTSEPATTVTMKTEWETETLEQEHEQETETNKTHGRILLLLVVVPTVASGNNVFRICMAIMGEPVGGITLAAVICGAAISLTYIGVKTRFATGLIIAVLLFETLANVTVIYDGLMGGLKNPTRFLGVVTDIFGTGTHGTAIFLGVFAAALLVGLQFAALFEIQKRK